MTTMIPFIVSISKISWLILNLYKVRHKMINVVDNGETRNRSLLEQVSRMLSFLHHETSCYYNTRLTERK